MQPDNISQNNISYRGITKTLKRHPFLYNENTAIDHGKVIGTIPRDFVKLNKNVRQTFAGINKTLCASLGTFSFLETYINTRLKSYLEKLSFAGFIKFSVEQVKYLCHGKSVYDRKFLFNFIGLDENFIKTTEKTLSANIKQGFADSGLIKGDDNLEMKLLDFGGFGTVYRMSCKDKEGKKVFNDKVLKFYRDMEEKESVNTAIELLNYRMIKKHDKICAFISKLLDFAFVKTGVLSKNIFYSLIGKKLSLINSCQNASQYEKIIKEQADVKNKNIFKKYHGVHREANIALFIQKNIGHSLKKSDAIDFWFSNPEYHYSVFEFSDKKVLGEVQKQNRPEYLGLKSGDITFNNRQKNYVDGRLIDYGDFKPVNKVLCNSKVARRYYKKIMNITGENKIKRQKELLEHYKQLALANKIPDSGEVLAGLREAEKVINS